MEKLRRENESLKTELAMEFRQFKKPVDSSSADRIAQVWPERIRRASSTEAWSPVIHALSVCRGRRGPSSASRVLHVDIDRSQMTKNPQFFNKARQLLPTTAAIAPVLQDKISIC